jgi:hypothetical protein
VALTTVDDAGQRPVVVEVVFAVHGLAAVRAPAGEELVGRRVVVGHAPR